MAYEAWPHEDELEPFVQKDSYFAWQEREGVEVMR